MPKRKHQNNPYKVNLTLQEVAERWQCSISTVRRLLRSGDLSGYRIGSPAGHWRVTPESVEAYEQGSRHRDGAVA